ncbi:hypothetical protein LPJ53_004171 [Coemansia erecta]|uniref:Protein Abitram n=1 Tax=Coemansia erecta TaxID=147472 RepID=A0A9W7XYD3_9FUNG|nr:hypothetical protein LPJ53_004171 [Coemansia erecta]
MSHMHTGSSVDITYDLAAYAHLDAWQAQPLRFLDRYFTTRYYCAPSSSSSDSATQKRKLDQISPDPSDHSESSVPLPPAWQYVRMAPNKLCVIGLASVHPLLDPSCQATVGRVARVEFVQQVADAQVRGKKKRGAQRLAPDTPVCLVHTDKGLVFTIRASVHGQLVEWNARLALTPELLYTHPEQAFFAIIKPGTLDNAKIFDRCHEQTDAL